MDMKKSSAMTEASGLVSDHEGVELAGCANSGKTAGARPLATPTQDDVMRWADHLRDVTAKAPLRSLLAAFVLGVWFARRR
ncbi:hypothetical protein [Bradyrhizobium sp.]|uniref:hypothetical protein n=1 Tax=Bradyrhizobium sp. TaxID=376 RepID=UPI0039E29E2A